MGGEAADVHDRACPALLEIGQAGLHAVERTVENDAGDRAPLFQRHVLECLLGAHRRVVDQDVDAAEARRGGRNHFLHCRAVGNIGSDAERLAARAPDLARDCLGFLEVGADVDDDSGAAVGKRERDAAADIAPGAGNDGDAAREFLGHGFRSSSVFGRDVGGARRCAPLSFTRARRKDRACRHTASAGAPAPAPYARRPIRRGGH
jgi:hypothetical protein